MFAAIQMFRRRYKKRFFFCASNAILGKIGQFAGEEVTLASFRAKCMPIYTDHCPTNSRYFFHQIPYEVDGFLLCQSVFYEALKNVIYPHCQ